MIPKHLFPATIQEALTLKKRQGDKAVFLAGGTDLFIRIWEKKIAPQCLIDLTKIPELSPREKIKGKNLFLGACLTVDQIARSSLVKKHAPSLALAASQLGSPALRNQATIAGNLGNASPAADLVPPLIAQGAAVHTSNTKEQRSLPVEELSTGVNKTFLFPDEMITHVSVPILQSDEGTAFFKLGIREALTISVATVAVWLRRNSRKEIQDLRIALGSVAPKVIRARSAEGFLKGKVFSGEIIPIAAKMAGEECQPISDIRASREYRRWMIDELVQVCLKIAWKAASPQKLCS